MTLLEKVNKFNDNDFKRVIGVEKETFFEMIKILEDAYFKKHKNKGRHTKLSIDEQLLMTLKYLRQYVTQKELSFEFGISESTVCDTIKYIENTLIQSGIFNLPGKKELLEDDDIEIILVDVTESPIERPKKSKKSGILEKRSDIL